MIRVSLIAAVALLAAACSPQVVGQTTTSPGSDAPMQSAEASACATRGGTMKQVGRMQSWQCVISYADAGKRCTDGDQCQGDCRIEGNSGVAPGAATAGVCQATSDRFGCNTPVEDGKAGPTLCID
jgi:putative hemolysin